MFIASYRNTERGAQKILAARLQQEIEEQRRLEEENRRLRQQQIMEMAALERQVLETRRFIETSLIRHRMETGEPYCPPYTVIERRICRVFGFKPSDIAAKRRHKRLVFARQAIAYWSTRRTILSSPEIGRKMGHGERIFDHTTILHSKKRYVEERAKMGRTLRPV